MVEQGPHKALAVGSNPARTTNFLSAGCFPRSGDVRQQDLPDVEGGFVAAQEQLQDGCVVVHRGPVERSAAVSAVNQAHVCPPATALYCM